MASRYDTVPNLDDENTSHALIAESVGHDKRVLDVGCATGNFAEALAERGCRVTGIEINPEAAQRAERYCERVIVGDVERLDLGEDLDEGSFDVIVFGDVLEHLKDPLATLKRLKPFLQPEGYAVASIPNVAHGSVRLALLLGRFRYRSLGLLDSTHLRFFTRESAGQLFEDAGFAITDLKHTSRGIFGTEVEVEKDEIPEEALRQVQEDPDSLTYQFVLKAYPFGKEDTLETYENLLYQMSRKLRGYKDVERRLEMRTRQLAEREKEVAKLTEQVIDLKARLARLGQRSRTEA